MAPWTDGFLPDAHDAGTGLSGQSHVHVDQELHCTGRAQDVLTARSVLLPEPRYTAAQNEDPVAQNILQTDTQAIVVRYCHLGRVR
jgi:hypothetical protein